MCLLVFRFNMTIYTVEKINKFQILILHYLVLWVWKGYREKNFLNCYWSALIFLVRMLFEVSCGFPPLYFCSLDHHQSRTLLFHFSLFSYSARETIWYQPFEHTQNFIHKFKIFWGYLLTFFVVLFFFFLCCFFNLADSSVSSSSVTVK